MAYFFTHRMTGNCLGDWIQMVLKSLSECELYPDGVTCDGAATNLNVLRTLGANLDLTHDFRPCCVHGETGEQCYIFLDIPHMHKLCRNLLHDMEVFVPGFEIPAQWKYFVALHEYQMEAGFRCLGNRITKNHVYPERQKMKVALAAQVEQ